MKCKHYNSKYTRSHKCKTAHNTKDALHEEKEAIVDYSKMAKTAKKENNTKAAKLFQHIGNEEKQHKAELTRLQRVQAKDKD